jgi:Undecaprenyl-phosphate glucose phosphotransferase
MARLTTIAGSGAFAIRPRQGKRLALPVSHRSLAATLWAAEATVIVALAVSCGLAYSELAFAVPGSYGEFAGVGTLFALVFVSVSQARGAYTLEALASSRLRIAETVAVWSLVFLAVASVAFLVKIGTSISRGFYLSFAVAGLIGIVWLRRGGESLFRRGVLTRALAGPRVLILGDAGELSDQRVILHLKRMGYRIDGILTFATADSADMHRAARATVCQARERPIDEILLFVGWDRLKPVAGALEALQALPLPIRLIADQNVRTVLGRSVGRAGSLLAVEIQRAPLGLVERAAKRAVDLFVASAVLLLFAPLLAFVALAIKLDSEGPVLFLQTRVGFSGRRFRILKFRTMSSLDDGAVVRQASRGDDRITRVGRWLRRTSVDELPQLINVLRGDMSLVGPRPHALAHDNQYRQAIANYSFRHHVKPGLTGWAQVCGYRGETPTLDLMEKRVEHDLWYINHWSLWLDFKVLVLTAFRVMGSEAF